MFDIQDRPGCITKAAMRALFERSISETKVFRENTPLAIITFNGVFSHYSDSDTDTMWIGFAIGMRCAERFAKAGAAPTAAAPTTQQDQQP